jgi:hypothetical protein
VQLKELHKIWFRPSLPSESNVLYLGRLRLRRGIQVFGVAPKSRDSSAGIVTRLQAEGLGIRILPRIINCPLFPSTSRLAPRPTQPVFGGYRDSFVGVNRPGREVGHSPPSSAGLSTNGAVPVRTLYAFKLYLLAVTKVLNGLVSRWAVLQ